MNILSERNPLVSVVMPVFNGEKYLKEAVQSILDQSLPDFEFIIFDDDSVDRSMELINEFKDKRIITKHFSTNVGNYRCRNYGMAIARGKYICVMDCDDISCRERFEEQVKFMERNPDTGICGCHVKNIPMDTVTRYVTDYDSLKVYFLSNNHCSHPSLIMRRQFLEKFKLSYNERYYYSADFDLCSTACRYFKVQNIPAVLLHYRKHSGQISFEKLNEQTRFADMIRINQLIDILGFKYEEIPVLMHLKLMKRQTVDLRYKLKVEEWIRRILDRNKITSYFNQLKLQQFLSSFMMFSELSKRE